jgi:hypothetical protein
VVGDSGYGDATEFRLGLAARGFTYVLEVDPTTSAYAADATPVTHLPRTWPPTQARLPRQAGQPVRPRPGRRAWRLPAGHLAPRHAQDRGQPTAKMRSAFLAIRVRPANHHIPRAADGGLPDVWLVAEWPPTHPNRSSTGYPTWTPYPAEDPGPAGEDPLANRTRLPPT